MNIKRSMTELIGNTPLLELVNIEKAHSLAAALLAKIEFLNPTGSIKDRAALGMIEAAERSGQIRPGSVLIEPTSGNTGIGLCAIAVARGYRAVIVMPDSMSAERISLMKAYGAQVELTPGALGMKGAIARAQALASELPDSFIPSQFTNPANSDAHYRTTGPELWADTDGEIGAVVAGIGSGGTISGVGRYLKERDPAIQIVGVEPAGSPVLTKGHAGAHKIQGIGAGFVTDILDRTVIDEVIAVADDDAFAAVRELAHTEGVLCGISSGAALWAAVELAKRPANAGKRICVLLPDTGDRYLSTPGFC